MEEDSRRTVEHLGPIKLPVRRDHGSWEYYRVLWGNQVIFIVTRLNSNLFCYIEQEIRISLKNSNVYHPSFTSQIICISMTLDLGANKNTAKLLITG